MKTAISVPDDTYGRVERLARRLGISRSEFYARAAARLADELDLRLASMPGNVQITSSPDGLDHDSVVNVTQMAPIGRDDLVERIGQIDHWTPHEVELGLRRVLDL